MSKVSYVVGQSYAIAVGLIHWVGKMNAARDTQPHLEPGKVIKSAGEPKTGVFESILQRGWASELPAQAILLPYSPKGGEAITAKDCIEDRKAIIAVHLDNKRDDLAAVCRELWCDENGKFIEPLFIGNSGFTRGLSLPEIILAKSKLESAAGREFNPVDFQVQVVVKAFGSESERLTEQAFENESRVMSGVTNMGWLDRIKSAQAMLAARRAEGKASTQSVLRDAFGVGNGQKLWAILNADARLPQLRLIERIRLPQPTDFRREPAWHTETGYIPVASIPQQANALRDAVDVATAEAFIAKEVFGKGSGNKPKMMGRPSWEALPVDQLCQEGSPMAAISKAVLNNEGFNGIKARYPELFSKDYAGTIASVKTEAKAKAKAK